MLHTVLSNTLRVALIATLCLAALPSFAGPDAARNKQLAQDFIDVVYNGGDLDAIPRFIADDFVDHSPGAPPDARGPGFVRRQAEGTYAAFPDLKFAIERMLAEGDLVAIHWSSEGTASAQAAGGGAEGKSVRIEGISIFRYDDEGKVAESWDLVDRAGMMAQLGFEIRPPGSADGAGEDGEGGGE